MIRLELQLIPLILARLLVDMAESEKYGYYHATNEGGYISWYDFTKEIFRQAVALGHTEYDENHVTVFPVTTAEYGMSKAARPFNSDWIKVNWSRLDLHLYQIGKMHYKDI